MRVYSPPVRLPRRPLQRRLSPQRQHNPPHRRNRPPPAQPAAPAKPAWEAQRDQLVLDAKKEGEISALSLVGAGYSRVLLEFGDKFGLETGNQSFNSSSIWGKKVAEERAAGIHSFDVAMVAPGSALRKYKAKNYWQPYRNLLIRPDVLGDENWTSGFEEGWVDDTKELCYSVDLTVTHVIGVDTKVVKEGEIKNALDLLNPKWRGRMIFNDPRAGDIRLSMTAIRLTHGDEIARRILIETEPVFNREARAIVEGVVRGKYAIGLGMRAPTVKEFVDLGVADNLQVTGFA